MVPGGAAASRADGPVVLGGDVAAGRWVGVLLGAGRPRVLLAPTVAEVLDRIDDAVDVVALDVPIGLPDAGGRAADAAARRAVGARSASVFTTPVRRAVLEGDYAAALAVQRAVTGQGLSRQAHGLRSTVLEVDAWAPTAPCRVVEAHPELCFATMAGAPLAHRKKSWAGAQQRAALLRAAGIDLSGDLGEAGAWAAVDDVLDAGAAAWTARRVALGAARCLPDPPEVFSDGWPAAIWA